LGDQWLLNTQLWKGCLIISKDFSFFTAASVQNIFHTDNSRHADKPLCGRGPMAQKFFTKWSNIKFHENPFGDTRVLMDGLIVPKEVLHRVANMSEFSIFIMASTTQTHSSCNLGRNFVTSFWGSIRFHGLLVFKISKWVYSVTLSCIQNMKCGMQSTCQVLYSTGSFWPTWKRRSKGITRRTRSTWGQREAWIVWFPAAAYGRHTAQHQTLAGQGVWWSWVSVCSVIGKPAFVWLR
jgi:hypothetical protein